jgi:cyclopropane-fatty-acyl-phospholipid synthase
VFDATTCRAAGTSPAAIARHYDLPADFFALWLGEERVYSCALWSHDSADRLEDAQRRKLDFFATQLRARGACVLDIGCGWGALLDRFVHAHGATGGVGLTLSQSQAAFARSRPVSGVEYRFESWVDHQPAAPYDAISCIEATEHLASDRLSSDEKVQVYSAFFEHCAGWLRDGGRLGLQLICLDNVGQEGSRPGRGPASELFRTDIFPESMPGSLGELVLGWETWFRVERFLDHSDHYSRTFRAWSLAYRAQAERARILVGDSTARVFARYFAAGETFFRLREDALYRVILEKRPRPKAWASPLRPSVLASADAAESRRAGASPTAVQAHYDVSNAFYSLWLGPTMMYTSGLWSGGHDEGNLDAAALRKVDFFASLVLSSPGADVLDVGCGWGGALRRLVERHQVASGLGLTLSGRQRDWCLERPAAGVEVRLEDWNDHVPDSSYDAIMSFGAFEHFARDGSTRVERVGAYRRFFSRCFTWLKPGGRVALETIVHDDAPDTASPLGRGPLGDSVLAVYPESICPHLSELVLGFEAYFELELLRFDASDFARTCRLWLLALRAHEKDAEALVGADRVRQFRRYLVSSEIQFRSGALTNCRVVLHRRPSLRW